MIRSQLKVANNQEMVYADLLHTIKSMFYRLDFPDCTIATHFIKINDEVIAKAYLNSSNTWHHQQLIQLETNDEINVCGENIFTISEAGVYEIQIVGSSCYLHKIPDTSFEIEL